ncbi:uncharacterized protein si:dkey-201i24.3 isoform X2 [Syngnathoides biaculeatus]|uniref:uncharacterized protein si:dkey-201i24.3 isoform X2 n=1 Tax=Syngnathoides biaculeatus TaxID=300417 RepID=UPI002ADD6AB1|nr:uncharacterized protein si:dkey-201i24.3 isoform X2 [Syngnathoides biaculeatus]
MQGLHGKLLSSITESMRDGYSESLLICGAPVEKNISALIDEVIVKQFHPEGSVVDLFNPDTQTLEVIPHPVLGGVIRGLGELCVGSADEAYARYKTCREAQNTKEEFVSTRCSSLFTLAVEQKLQEGKASFQLCRSKLQVFILVGAATGTDLMGVNPLQKVTDQIPGDATKTDPLLHFLLSDALTGNTRTALIYCIQPQDALDDETESALALAQKVKCFTTRASVRCWSPEKTERDIRGRITELRHVMMSDASNGMHNIHRLAELIQSLQIGKEQSWEKKREGSERIRLKLGGPQKGQLGSDLSPGHSVAAPTGGDTTECLRRNLRQEMEAYLREDGGSVDKIQERLTRILQLREALREEPMKNISAEKCDLCLQLNDEYHLEDCHAHERRRELRALSGRLIQQEMEKMERDLAREQLPCEGVHRDLLVMSRERYVLVLQMEALREEALQAHKGLQEQRHKHQSELRRLREESLEVFRRFHESSEDLRRMSEARYRSVLLEAVHDAAYQSAQNQQLQADNKQLCKGVFVRTIPSQRDFYMPYRCFVLQLWVS